MRHVYHIAPHYRFAEIWSGDAMSGERKCVQTCRPKTALSHRQRYEAVAEFLNRNGIAPPIYKARGTPEPLAWQDKK